mgnify:CR=1 FL=1
MSKLRDCCLFLCSGPLIGAQYYIAPTDPTDPTDPIAATDPSDPSGPTDPIGPTDPTDPNDPTDPRDLIDPSEPTSRRCEPTYLGGEPNPRDKNPHPKA